MQAFWIDFIRDLILPEMMLHACVPSFISMRGTVSGFEE